MYPNVVELEKILRRNINSSLILNVTVVNFQSRTSIHVLVELVEPGLRIPDLIKSEKTISSVTWSQNRKISYRIVQNHLILSSDI